MSQLVGISDTTKHAPRQRGELVQLHHQAEHRCDHIGGGATGPLILDNISTLLQASSLYFALQSTTADSSTLSCIYGSTNTAAFCAIKVTQSALQ